MISHCANPSCTAAFKYFGTGKLFVSEQKSSGGKPGYRELFWLCERCCKVGSLTLMLESLHFEPVAQRRDGPLFAGPVAA